MKGRKKQRILCVHTGGEILRGSEIMLLEVLKGIEAAGRELLLLCDQEIMRKSAMADGHKACKIASGEIMIDPPEYRFDLRSVLSANRTVFHHLKRWAPEVIYCNGGRSSQAALIAAGLTRKPLVVHLHSPYYKRYHWLYGTPWVSAVIHCSGSMKNYHEKLVRFRKSVLILNGVEMSALQGKSPPENTAQFPAIPDSSVILGFIGSLIPRKGVDVLIEAVAVLRKEHRAVHLVIGGQEQNPEYRERVVALGLEPYVHFVGEVKDRSNFFSRIHVHVLPSRSEAFGRTVVEAAACGVPSVAHDVEGIREAMCDGRFGELYRPNIPTKLAESITKIINDRRWRRRSAHLAALARNRFDIPRVVDQIFAVLDAV